MLLPHNPSPSTELTPFSFLTAIHVCTISIFSTIQDSDPKYNKDAIAKVYWQAHQDGVERGRSEILY